MKITLDDLTPRRLKIALIGAPFAVAALYFTVFAADRYVSESTVALQRTSNDASAIPGAALLLAGLNPPSREETQYLRQYVRSLALLQVLDARLGIRRHYEAQKLDFATRLYGWASREDFLDYWRNRVDVSIDDLSSAVTLRVQGFDAKFAQTLNRAILDESERFVNEMSHRLAREKMAFAETELARAAEKLQSTRTEVLAFQAKNRLLDPARQAEASGAVVAEMQVQITKAEAELGSLRTFLNEDAYQVRALRAQIAATQAQLDVERARSTGVGQGSDRLNALAIDFQGLKMKADFALDGYKVALGAVENARIDATRKLATLTVIEPATLPEAAEYPRRVYNLATLLVACLLAYGVVRLTLATIREHQD